MTNDFRYSYYINFTLDQDEYGELYKEIYNKEGSDEDVLQFIQDCVRVDSDSFEDDLKKYTCYDEPATITNMTKNNAVIATICDNLKTAIQGYINGAQACIIRHIDDHFEVVTIDHGKLYTCIIKPFIEGHTYTVEIKQ
jgi:hypothetical protein